MSGARRWGALSAVLLLVGLSVAACGGSSSSGGTTQAPPATSAAADTGAANTGAAAASAEPIVIGAAVDLTGNMAPFDGPALEAAKLEVQNINDAGGVNGQQLELKVIDTQLDPAKTKAAAIDLINQGAKVLLVTCDVDFATPAVQEAITQGVLAVAPCIGTDQMGPKRFGTAGKLAFSLGNVAQDEGAAMAEFAWSKGWKTAATAKDNVIVYFQDIIDAFTSRFKELGGKIVKEDSWTNGDGTVGNVAQSVGNANADVIVTATAYGDLPALVTGIRSLGIDTPILCSWACDGAYWLPKEPLSNFYYVTYASVFGDDPSPDVQDLIDAMKADGKAPGTGGFITGAAAIDAIAAAMKSTGSTDGATLADAFEKFNGLDTISGKVSFSPELHSVTGREYRVMEVQNGKNSFIKLLAATSPATISGG